MNRTVWKGGGTALLTLGLAACGVIEPDRAEYTVTLTNPTDQQAAIPLSFTAEVSVEGGFTLTESGCDPSAVSMDLDHFVLHPEWDPYDCTEDDGTVSQTEGNIQLFIDGIFYAYSTSPSIELDLTPRVGPFAYYDYIYDDAGEPIPDVDGNGTEDLFKYCSIYFPDDNLGYASTYYNEGISLYSFDVYYGIPLNDLDEYASSGNVVALDPQPPPYDTIFDFFFVAPWLKFDYFRNNGTTDEHIWWAELHAVNHSAIYGVPRELTFTQGFEITDEDGVDGDGDGVLDGDGYYDQFPDDWCGNFGFANVF